MKDCSTRTQEIYSRLINNTAIVNGCYEWKGSRNKDGYGQASVNGRRVLAHRAIWSLIHGQIPEKMYICHKCDNPPCINPEHLFLGTPSDNQKDSYRKGRNCQKGANRGEKNGRKKLSLTDVMFLREQWASTKFERGEKKKFFRKHANMYCVSTSAIEMCVKRHRWAHIAEGE